MILPQKAFQNNGLDKKLLNNGIALKNLLTHDELLKRYVKQNVIIDSSISEECSIL